MNAMIRKFGLALVSGLLLTACGEKKAESKPDVPGQQFGTAEEAAAALVAAADPYDVAALTRILGSQGEALVATEDSVASRNTAREFAAQAKQAQHLEYDSTKTSATLIVGPEDWPLPIPIVKKDSTWFFDVAAGREEILNRRIGGNELNAIDVCHEYVAAQLVYARRRHDGALVNQYAQRVISQPGKQDGLAWRGADSSWQGPMGPSVAEYISEGYTDKYRPLHGYYFKILKAQGPAAPLGAMDFTVEGAMIGGFALVAAPAEYGVTGVQTFIVGYDGVVYQKDQGTQSMDLFRAMDRYNPDSTWKLAEQP